MARQVYSTVLASQKITTASLQDLFVVPAGKTAVVRSVDVVTNAGGPNLLTFSQASDSVLWWLINSAADDGWFGWRGHQVFDEGETALTDNTGGTWYVRVSGYLLTA